MRLGLWDRTHSRVFHTPWGLGIDYLVGVVALFVLLVLLVAIVIALVGRSRRRERLINEALRNGQPEFALYLAQGGRRFLAGIILLLALFALFAFLLEDEWGLAAASSIVTAVCLIMLLKRHPLPRPPRPPQAGCGAEVPPKAPGSAPPPPKPDAASVPAAENSNGFLEKAIAIAVAILIVLAGLAMIGRLPFLVLIAGVAVLLFFAASRQKRVRCLRFLSRQTEKLRRWFDSKADRN